MTPQAFPVWIRTSLSFLAGLLMVFKSREKRDEEKAKKFCAELGLNWETLSDKVKLRAKRLMSPCYSWSPGKSIKEHYKTTFREFERFLQISKIDWKSATYECEGEVHRSLFFEEEDIDNFMVICRQSSGFCCLIASVTFQHYLQLFKNDGTCSGHSTLDIAHYIREKAPKEKQKQYLLTGNLGINAIDFFSEIIGTNSRNQMPTFGNAAGSRMALSRFTYMGPALVYHFACGKTFSSRDQSKVTFQNKETDFRLKDDGTKVYHTMVVIGMYVDDTGMLWCLIQNPWKDFYFQEVSAEYLESCEAALVFCHDYWDTTLKDDPTTVDDVYAEISTSISEGNDALEDESCDGGDCYSRFGPDDEDVEDFDPYSDDDGEGDEYTWVLD